MSEETKKTVRKRPKKEETVNILLNMASFVENQVGGFTPEIFKAQCEKQGLFLYESEVPEVVKKQQEKEPSFNGDFFTNLLLNAGAIEEGDRPYFGGVAGGGLTRINTRERAEEVANDPKDVEAIMEIMSDILALGEKLNPMIDKKAELSVALKNKGKYIKRRKKEVETTDDKS